MSLRPNKVAIIGSVGIPAKYGGFETLVEYLTLNLNKETDFTVYCSANEYETKLERHNSAQLDYIPLKANGIQSIPYDIWSLLKVKKETKVVLILGVACGFFLPIYKLFTKKKLILNVDGLEWKRAKWGKLAKWYLKNSEKIAVRYSDVIVADNKIIQEHVFDSYGKKAELIEYGGDHVKTRGLSSNTIEEYSFTNTDYAFKVCRIEPENNIHMILEAFSEQTKYDLTIVGNWKNSSYGLELIEKYASFEHIHLLDPIYNQVVLNELRSNCFFYVHGHSAGGTNPSLVEAMFLNIPIISFDVNYNRETTEHNALGYFKNASELKFIIENVSHHVMKESMKKLTQVALNRYNWKLIAKKYQSLFN